MFKMASHSYMNEIYLFNIPVSRDNTIAPKHTTSISVRPIGANNISVCVCSNGSMFYGPVLTLYDVGLLWLFLVAS